MTLTWANGRQLSTLTKSGSTYSYNYDIDGNRTKKVANGVTTEYYLNEGTIVAEKAGSNVIRYLFDENGDRFGLEYNGSKYVYLFNAQGDVVAIVNSSNQLVAKYAYDAWGKLLSITGSAASTVGAANPIRYRGYYYDTETGLYYLNSRYYDPQTGRFINADSEDILQVQDDLFDKNLFAYCDNNPIMREDHGGERWSWKTFFGGVAVVAAVVAVAAFTVASGGTAAVAIAGVIGVKTATVTAAATTVAAYSCAYGVAAGIGYGVASNSRGSNYRYATNNNRGKQKGKEFRGGSKKTRDKWFGNNDKNFQKWYERYGKKYYNDGFDIDSRSEMEMLYDIWKILGRPRMK